MATKSPKQGIAPSKKRTSPGKVGFAFFGFAVLVGWLYLFFVSDLFLIDTVEVRGLKATDPVDVTAEVFRVLDEQSGWRPWPARHAWFINPKKMAEELQLKLFAEQVIVDKPYGHVLRLMVHERSNKLVFHSHQQYLWVDLQGVITAELLKEERTDIQARLLGQRPVSLDEPPVIHRDLDELVTTGYHVAESDNIKTWIKNADEIRKAGIEYREFSPPATSSNQGIFVSPQGYDVLIDMSVPLEPQLKTYQAFAKSAETANPKIEVTQYVDARIPGRVYVK